MTYKTPYELAVEKWYQSAANLSNRINQRRLKRAILSVCTESELKRELERRLRNKRKKP